MADQIENSEDKKQVGIKLSADARKLREALSRKLGIDKTAVVELAIREKAARDGVTLEATP
ncbi:MAG TPA: hypothetical protein VF719_03260 [Abditibacteriaceae bacterium]|jgi:hypothetical protein